MTAGFLVAQTISTTFVIGWDRRCSFAYFIGHGLSWQWIESDRQHDLNNHIHYRTCEGEREEKQRPIERKFSIALNEPWNKFNEIVIERNAGLRIEDRGVRVTDEVGRDHFVIGITQNAFQWTIWRFFDGSTDFFVFGLNDWSNATIAKRINRWRTPLFRRAVKSTTETFGVGTRKAIPVSLPFNSGITLPT